MNKYNKKNYKSINEAKNFFRDDAWEFFKKQNNLPVSMTRANFEKFYKDDNLIEKWGAFRHYYTSAAFTKTYGETAAKLLGDANEIIQFGSIKSFPSLTEYNAGNKPLDRRMDIKNNAAGRELAKNTMNDIDLLSEAYYTLTRNPDVVLNQNIYNEDPYNDNFIMNAIWKAADLAYYEREQKKHAKDNILNGQIIYNKPLSLKERLMRAREEKLARYTQRLAESPEKIAQMQANHVSLEELKAPQEAKKQKVRDIVKGKVQFDENADLSGYVNKKSNDNRIFTQEDLDEMIEAEKKENAQAIMYQKQTIGVPTREQAKKAVEKGGMVHVRAYTRADGTKVRSHYRSR